MLAAALLLAAAPAALAAASCAPISTGAVEALFDRWNAALASGDPGEVSALYSPDALLLPEQMVLRETDATKAREIGRQQLKMYIRLPNYQNNLKQFGFTDADFEDTLRIVEATNYAQCYSFKYSRRPGTPGADMKDQVDEAVKTERLARLLSMPVFPVVPQCSSSAIPRFSRMWRRWSVCPRAASAMPMPA